jgi:hypothetical protein
MKKLITQTYELTVSYLVDVEDNETDEDIKDTYGELNIAVTVTDHGLGMEGLKYEFEGVDDVTPIQTYVMDAK